MTGCSSGIGGATAQNCKDGGTGSGCGSGPPAEGMAQFYQTNLNDADSIHETVGALNSTDLGRIRVTGLSGVLRTH